jgi:hypothetical protein
MSEDRTSGWTLTLGWVIVGISVIVIIGSVVVFAVTGDINWFTLIGALFTLAVSATSLWILLRHEP